MHLNTEDGELGFEASDAEAYFEHLFELMEAGGYPRPQSSLKIRRPDPMSP